MLRSIGIKIASLEERFAPIKKIANFGIDESMSVDTQKRLAMTNYIHLISTTNNILLFFVFLFMQAWYLLAGLVAALLFNVWSLWLMKRGRPNLPRLLYAPIISSVIVFCDYHLVGSSTARLFLFPVSFLGFLYFSKDDYKHAVVGAIICLLALVGINLLDIFDETGQQFLAADVAAWVDLLLSAASFVCTIAVVVIFYVQNIKAELRLQKEREKLSYIFDTVEEGLIMTDSSGHVQPEYSRYTESLLESRKADIIRHGLIEAVFARSLLTEDVKDQCRTALVSVLGGDELQWIGNEECFPREFQIKTQKGVRDLHAKWQPLYKNEIITGVLVSLQDVTEEKQKEELLKQREAKQQVFQEIVHAVFQTSRSKVEHFLQDAVRLLDIESIQDQNSFRVGLHTLKGAARTLHLTRLSAAVHILEDHVAKSEDPSNWLVVCLDEVKRVQAEFKEFLELLHSVLGGASTQNEARPENLMGIVAELMPMVSRQCQDAQLEFGGIQVYDRVVQWSPEHIKVVKTALMHAMTNSVDHGYLFPWQEGRAAKKPVNLIIQSERDGSGQTFITYTDSGAGISDAQLQKLLAKAGKQAESLTNPFDVLFLDGLSSANQVSQTSGRGVGMPAIRQVVKAVQGTVEVSRAITGGLQLKIAIPVKVPDIAQRKTA